MRWLSWIVMLPLAAAAIVFSVSNRAVTPVDFWPFGFIVELPVFGIVLESLLLVCLVSFSVPALVLPVLRAERVPPPRHGLGYGKYQYGESY